MPSEDKDEIQLLQGTLDLIVRRTLARGTGGRTESNREAKYYEITKAGQKAIGAETQKWRTMAVLVERLLLGELQP